MDKLKNMIKKSKRGLFSVDASFAVIIILTMSLLFYLFAQAISSSMHNLDTRQKTISLIVFSNEIVRKEGAYKTNTETISNIISLPELNSFKTYLSKLNSSAYGFGYVEWKLYDKNNSLIDSYNKTFQDSQHEEVYCINRLVLIHDSNTGQDTEGTIKVCIR